jgi:hypothetical protein
MSQNFHELVQLQQLIDEYSSPLVRSKKLADVDGYPIWGLSLGSQDPKAPTLALVAGVHGLEKIGTQVLIAYLSTLLHQATWDKNFQKVLNEVRIVSIPILNPTGMAKNIRSNYNGVDLMRNSPIESNEPTTRPLVSGHRLGPFLPWFRGKNEMEVESRTLIEFMTKEALQSKVCLSIDFHSGFGMKDRLWFPYAKSKEPFPDWNQVMALKDLFKKSYPYHIYKIESQSDSYTTHGDLWDYIYEIHRESEEFKNNTFIPWTLEMGSWMWVKKNPFQLLNPLGLFNPIKAHRFDRVMRRHILLIDFFLKAVRNPESWMKK